MAVVAVRRGEGAENKIMTMGTMMTQDIMMAIDIDKMTTDIEQGSLG